MADEKVNMGPEENKTSETLSPPGQGDLPPLEKNNAPAVSGEDKAAPSGKVINFSDIQTSDKGGKETSTTAPDKKAPWPSPERACYGVCGEKGESGGAPHTPPV